jgi:hypothetical protein
VQQPLSGSLDNKLQQIADMLQVVADGETVARRLLDDLRRSDAYALAYSEPEPLVSVVITTYMSYETLRDLALPSVLNQTYANIEVIVVGDDAPAETAEVMRRIGDPRVRFENLPMRGPYPEDPQRRWLCSGTPPYNAGVAAARGRWLTPLSDDDAFLPDHVERLLTAARERRLEFVYGRLLAHVPNGDPVLVGEFPPRIGEFGLQGAMYHLGLRFFGLELSDAVFDVPNDWSLCRRMMRAGVRMGMVDAVVTDYYPSADWGRRQRPEEPAPEAEPAPEPGAGPQTEPETEPEPQAEEHALAPAAVPAAEHALALAAAQAELAQATAEVAGLRAHAADLQRRLDVIAGSSSWRITRPLRAVAAKLRGR